MKRGVGRGGQIDSWREVFTGMDPFGWPFAPWVRAGGVLYPTDGLHLTRGQYKALAAALVSTGESGFFLSVVESEGLGFQSRSWGHWWCEQMSYEEYRDLHLTLENAIYSKDGGWGILISHEMHAVEGGRAEFLGAFTAAYATWTEDLHALRAEWTNNPNSDWMRSLPEFVNL